jgi:hypothetical protein
MAKDQTVTATMGVNPCHLILRKVHEAPIRQAATRRLEAKALFCTSVRKIQFKYGPILKKYFGDVPIVEMYTAT